MSQMNYNQFAWYYDSLMEPKFYEDYFHFICNKANFSNVLDLGCGTGRIDAMLASQANNITAVDLSNQMIEVAKQTINNKNCRFEVADMTTYRSSESFDLVLCICDSLNYVLGFQNQVKVLESAYYHLKNNGTFIFDIHSEYKMNVLFKDYLEEEENEDFYFYWKVKKTGEYQITHYVIIEDLTEDTRMEEKHVQESYPIGLYIKELKRIGFNSVDFYDDFQDNQRIIIVAKK